MKENVVKQKSFEFVIRIVNLYEYLIKKEVEHILSKQILRSGTAIGAMIREAKHSESTKGFFT